MLRAPTSFQLADSHFFFILSGEFIRFPIFNIPYYYYYLLNLSKSSSRFEFTSFSPIEEILNPVSKNQRFPVDRGITCYILFSHLPLNLRRRNTYEAYISTEQAQARKDSWIPCPYGYEGRPCCVGP